MQPKNTWKVHRDRVIGNGRNAEVVEMVGPTMGVLKRLGINVDKGDEMDKEMELMKELHHPNICSVYAYVREGVFNYLLLERLGQPLTAAYIEG